MDRVYVYNKVRSLLAVFVAFEVLNGEDKKPGRGKTRQWIRRRDEKGYFNNIVKELAVEDTAEYIFSTNTELHRTEYYSKISAWLE